MTMSPRNKSKLLNNHQPKSNLSRTKKCLKISKNSSITSQEVALEEAAEAEVVKTESLGEIWPTSSLTSLRTMFPQWTTMKKERKKRALNPRTAGDSETEVKDLSGHRLEPLS